MAWLGGAKAWAGGKLWGSNCLPSAVFEGVNLDLPFCSFLSLMPLQSSGPGQSVLLKRWPIWKMPESKSSYKIKPMMAYGRNVGDPTGEERWQCYEQQEGLQMSPFPQHTSQVFHFTSPCNPGVWPLVTMQMHNTKILGKGNRFSVREFPFRGGWEHSCSELTEPTSPAKQRKPATCRKIKVQIPVQMFPIIAYLQPKAVT